MQNQPQEPQQQPTHKFPAAAALERALLGNLTANNANPQAIQSQDDERQALAAKSTQRAKPPVR